ncbi:MAG TPA: hypothetical protein VFI19_16880 [Nocardioides sp.]|nr:hypothetical protein [Nocardioides sp.]
MSLSVITYVLTALAAVVVVLTRLRMRGGLGAGRFHVGNRLLDVHTVCGVLAVIIWTVFLLLPDDAAARSTVGIVGLGLFWIVTIAGLLILVRWLPSHGRHASEGVQDSWSEGPGLSVLAHIGMLVGVIVFTYVYLNPTAV